MFALGNVYRAIAKNYFHNETYHVKSQHLGSVIIISTSFRVFWFGQGYLCGGDINLSLIHSEIISNRKLSKYPVKSPVEFLL